MAYFYDDPRFAFYYDICHGDVSDMPIAHDVPFYAECARAFGHPVLELGCGTGRVGLELAQAGFEVVGLDLSRSMLARAEEKLAALPAAAAGRVQLVHGDMREVALDAMFPLAIVPFRAFQYLLTPGDQRRCLRTVRAHLVPGGRFVLHLFDPRLEWCHDGPAESPTKPGVYSLPDGGRLDLTVESRRNDAAAQTLTEMWRYREIAPDGSVRSELVEPLTLRWTYRYEMEHLLELERYEVEALHGGFQGEPFRHGGEQVWVARRR